MEKLIEWDIKEPDNIDFTIKSNPISDKDRKEIINFIADYKQKRSFRKKLNPLGKSNKIDVNQ